MCKKSKEEADCGSEYKKKKKKKKLWLSFNERTKCIVCSCNELEHNILVLEQELSGAISFFKKYESKHQGIGK